MRVATSVAALASLIAAEAHATFTDTLPSGAFLVDASYIWTDTRVAYDNDGAEAPLLPNIDRYEPGGGYQGTITVNAVARYSVFVSQLQYGILDNLTAAVAIPVATGISVDPRLGWTTGDYQRVLGRPYGEEDFWQWAGTLGQDKPGKWTSGAKLTDLYVGGRYRFTDGLSFFEALKIDGALQFLAAIPTGSKKDPEEITALGTTAFELHFQGEINTHLSFERTLLGSTREGDGDDRRLRIGLDLFYEALLERTYDTPRGEKHPLLLTYAPYAGDTYKIDPGDFWGGSIEITGVPWVGPAIGTWITKGSAAKASELPPLLALTAKYTFLGLQQSEWTSDSALFDWQNEQQWRPGYKNIFTFGAQVSLLRVGVPVQLYGRFRTMRILAGKNHRAVQGVTGGLQLPLKFW